jgi:hypothetical protein
MASDMTARTAVSRTRSLNEADTPTGIQKGPMQQQNRRTQGGGRSDGYCCLAKNKPAGAVWGRSPAGSCVSSNKEDKEGL